MDDDLVRALQLLQTYEDDRKAKRDKWMEVQRQHSAGVGAREDVERAFIAYQLASRSCAKVGAAYANLCVKAEQSDVQFMRRNRREQ
jgi:hypothetical protein